MNQNNGNAETLNISDLYSKYKKEIYAFFLFHLEDKNVVEDLTQEVFVRAVQYKHTVLDTSKARPWLFKIAKNVFHSYCKKHKKELSMIIREESKERAALLDHVPSSESVENFVVHKENINRLIIVLESLSEKEKLLIQFRFLDHKSFKEISDIIGENENTIKARLYRSLKKCLDKYEELEKKENRDVPE